MNRITSVLLLCCLVSFVANSHAATITALPSIVTLDGPQAYQKLSVVNHEGGHYRAAVLPADVTWTSSDENVVRIDGGIAVAVSDGNATLTASLATGEQATIAVQVHNTARPAIVSFRNEVESLLARHGCNTGACHGALAGKGGFRLSLHGYDADADFFSITREARGRRIEKADPGRSLVLAKPSGALPHKGGVKLAADSADYQRLAAWIAAGAAAPADDDARLTHITVTPENSLLAVGDQTQILVTAHYDDGRDVDVTQWAKFTATDETILSVNRDGWVSIVGSGEGAVLVWFGSQVVLARMTVPYPYDVADDVFRDAPQENFIDDLNLAQLQTLKLRPSPTCDRETYLRRATLDTIGRLPTVQEREAFLSDASPQAKQRLIGRLLSSADYVDYWTYRISDILLINGTRLRPAAVQSYYKWVHDAVRENRPWDQFVREILVAKGVSTEQGATNFYALHQSPEEMTENACQAFMGLSIGCSTLR